MGGGTGRVGDGGNTPRAYSTGGRSARSSQRHSGVWRVVAIATPHSVLWVGNVQHVRGHRGHARRDHVLHVWVRNLVWVSAALGTSALHVRRDLGILARPTRRPVELLLLVRRTVGSPAVGLGVGRGATGCDARIRCDTASSRGSVTTSTGSRSCGGGRSLGDIRLLRPQGWSCFWSLGTAAGRWRGAASGTRGSDRGRDSGRGCMIAAVRVASSTVLRVLLLVVVPAILVRRARGGCIHHLLVENGCLLRVHVARGVVRFIVARLLVVLVGRAVIGVHVCIAGGSGTCSGATPTAAAAATTLHAAASLGRTGPAATGPMLARRTAGIVVATAAAALMRVLLRARTARTGPMWPTSPRVALLLLQWECEQSCPWHRPSSCHRERTSAKATGAL